MKKKSLPRISIKKLATPMTHITFRRRNSCAEVTMRDSIWMWELTRPFITQKGPQLRCMLHKTQQSLQDLQLRQIHTFKSRERILKLRFKELKNACKPCRRSENLN